MKQHKNYISDILEKSRDRRTFMKKISLGSAGLFLPHAVKTPYFAGGLIQYRVSAMYHLLPEMTAGK